MPVSLAASVVTRDREVLEHAPGSAIVPTIDELV
jgi:hypothetical protein